MWRGIPAGDSHDVVLMLVTAVVTYTGSMISFRYGSTQGSELKNKAIGDLAQASATTAATASSPTTTTVTTSTTAMPDTSVPSPVEEKP